MSKLYNLNNEFIRECQGIVPENFTGIHIVHNGNKFYRLNGERHRLDGPAIEYASGYKEWFVDGKEVTELECKLLCDLMRLKGLT